MNPLPTAGFWLQALGSLALQCAAVLAIAGAAQCLLRSPRWRHATWLAALTVLALVLVNSLAGWDGRIAGWWAQPVKPAPHFIVRNNLPVGTDASFAAAADAELRAALDSAVSEPVAAPTVLTGVWWPAWVWLTGSLLVAVWSALPRVWLAVVLRRSRLNQPVEGPRRIALIAERLGLRQSVRLYASPKLAGPIAFGVLRPSVGVPTDFWTRHSRAEQDAMLAHELAHLAARDPLWLALADTLTALLWWHPLVWWGRRQFRTASEAAADEASLVIEGGPAVLAGCLVALAAQWQRRGVLGLLGMAGFRSGLGRRVENLLRLKPTAPGRLRPSRWQRLLFALGSVAALAAAITVPFWVLPVQSAQRPSLLAVISEALTPTPVAQNDTTVSPTLPPPAIVADSQPDAAGQAATESRSAELTVQLPPVPGMDPKTVRVVSMDALTRRLYALDRFSRVKCEPVGDDQVRVLLTERAGLAGSTNTLAELMPILKRLVEQPGQLAFRRVHPQSDSLVSQGVLPDGYEVMSEASGPNRPARRHLVARDAFPGVGSTNLQETGVARDPISGEPRIQISFDWVGAKAFWELTQASVGNQIAVVLDGALLSAPRVNEPIKGGNCEISGGLTEIEVALMVSCLRYPLPGAPTVLEVVMPLRSAAAPSAAPDAVYATNAVGHISFLQPDPQAAAALAQDAKLLYEQGKLDEAKAKASEALKLDPGNLIAAHYLDSAKRDLPPERMVEVEKAWNPPKTFDVRTSALTTVRWSAELLRPLWRELERTKSASAVSDQPIELLRERFAAAGASFSGTNTLSPASDTTFSGFQNAEGKALLLDTRTGNLTIRTTPSEYSLIERILDPSGTLVMDAKLLYELGKLDEAKAKATEALKLDPGNQAAEYYLNLVREAEAAQARRGHERGDPAPLAHPTRPLQVGSSATADLDDSLKAALRANGKSEAEIATLRGVAQALTASGQVTEAERVIAIALGRDDATRRVRIEPPAENARAATTPPDPLFTRTYRVNPNLINERLGGGASATNAATAKALLRLFSAAGVDFGETNVLDPASGLLGSLPGTADLPVFQGPSRRALFFKDRVGLLLVRATLSELDAIEQLLEVLNASPPQVMIEAKFVEITDDGSQSSNFDWFLGTVPMNTNAMSVTNATGASNTVVFSPEFLAYFGGRGVEEVTRAQQLLNSSTGQVATVTGIMTDPQFREVTAALEGSGTNAVQEHRGDQLSWPGRDATNAGNIKVNAALGTSLRGVLTDAQFRVAMRALEGRFGVDVLSAPKVTTLSGRQAQIQMVDIRSIITGINPNALTDSGVTPSTNASPSLTAQTKGKTGWVPAVAPTTNAVPFTTSQVPVGPTLDVIPTVAADGYTIQLTVIPTVTEFLGYDEPPKGARVEVQTGEGAKPVAVPLPRFRVRQMHTQAQIWDGQTLVLGGFPVEETRRTKDKVPVLGDIPLMGRLFRSESQQSVRKTLLVFVTATIVDPAGNRVHTADSGQLYAPGGATPKPAQ